MVDEIGLFVAPDASVINSEPDDISIPNGDSEDRDTSPDSVSGPGQAGRPITVQMLGNIGLTVVALVSSGLVPLGFNLAVGRHYGAATLGSVSVALGLALFLGQIPGTLSSAATKFIAEYLGKGDEATAGAVFWFLLRLTLAASIILGVLVMACAPIITAALHISLLTVVLSAALVPTYTLYLYFKSVYYGIQKVRAYLFNEVVSDIAFFGALAAMFVIGLTPWLLLAFVLNNALFAGLAAGAILPRFRFADAKTWGSVLSKREVLSYCLINGSGTAASLGRWSLGTTVAGLFITHHQVGLFAAAVAITGPLALLPRAISLVTFASMARLHGAGESAGVQRLMQFSTEWLVFVLGIPSGLAILNASTVLTVLYRSDFAPAGGAAALIIAGAYITDISRPSIDALSSTRHVRLPAMASYAGLAVSLVLWFALIPPFGITMAGGGFLIGALVTAALPAYFACRRMNADPSVFIRPTVLMAALAGLYPLATHQAVIASVLFVLLVLILYRHLLAQLVHSLRRLLKTAPNSLPITTGDTGR